MKFEFLYRGVSLEMHQENTGLKPKGTSLSRSAQHGPRYARHGSGLTHGTAVKNGLLAHQTSSSEFPSSGVSSTTEFEIAKKYATHNFNTKGFVYKIDTSLLEHHNIKAYSIKDFIQYPQFPEDNEIILVHKEGMELPLDIVVEIIELKL